MIPAPPDGSNPAIVRQTDLPTWNAPSIFNLSFQTRETFIEVFDDDAFTATSRSDPFGAQVFRLLSFSAEEFSIQTTVVFHDAPVWRDSLAAIRAIFFGSFGGDAHKDSRR